MFYKALSSHKNLTGIDFRQQGLSDSHLLALVEALYEMPMLSTLDLRDNEITDIVSNLFLYISLSVL